MKNSTANPISKSSTISPHSSFCPNTIPITEDSRVSTHK